MAEVATPLIERLVVVGLGLIGGSFAKGARASGLCREVVGIDRDPETRRLAVELGVVDRCVAELAEACPGADVIQLAVPTTAESQRTARAIPDAGLLDTVCILSNDNLMPPNIATPCHDQQGPTFTSAPPCDT